MPNELGLRSARLHDRLKTATDAVREQIRAANTPDALDTVEAGVVTIENMASQLINPIEKPVRRHDQNGVLANPDFKG